MDQNSIKSVLLLVFGWTWHWGAQRTLIFQSFLRSMSGYFSQPKSAMTSEYWDSAALQISQADCKVINLDKQHNLVIKTTLPPPC